MSSVDDRIVNMSFNNKQFESGAAQSMRTLDQVESKLAKAGNSKGLSGMANGVQQVQSKFSAMQVAGVTAIATITNKAVNAGINIVKSLTLNPFKQGFQEYQTNLNSIQTIMSNTGEDVKTVNKYLDVLNKYSDKTIYNFSEMARNIGTFTAAGVKLEPAVQSIKGIANLAALSGSSSQQASTAMYQLSQAISAGRVGLQDWNSVVNAGMGGKIFQEALARTASNMGDLTEGAVKLNKETGQLTINGESFRQSISTAGGGTSWLSGTVLTDTLQQLAGGFTDAQLAADGFTKKEIKQIQDLADTGLAAAQDIKTLPQLFQVVQESIGSMWAATFRNIFGNFEQSKKLWTRVGSVVTGFINNISTYVNGPKGLLTMWQKLGGRDDLLRGFERAFKNIWRIIVPFKNAFRDIFPPASVNFLVKFTQGFKNLSEFLYPSVDTMHQLRRVFAGFFAVIHIGFEVIKGITGAVASFFGALASGSGGARTGVLEILASIGDVLVALDKWLTSGGKLNEIFAAAGQGVGAAVKPIIAAINMVISAITNVAQGGGISGFLAPFQNAKGVVLDFIGAIVDGLARITAPFEKVSNFFAGLKAKISAAGDSVSDFTAPISSAADRVEGTITKGIVDPLNKVQDAASTTSARVAESFGAVSDSVGKVEDAASSTSARVAENFDTVSSGADSVKDSVTGVFDVFGGPEAKAAQQTTENIGTSAQETGSKWDAVGDKVSNSVGKVSSVASGIGTALEFIKDQISDLFGDLDALEFVGFINAILTGAILLKMAKTFESFASWTDLFKKAFTQTVESVTDTMKSFQQSLKAKAIRDIAIAIGILAGAILVLSLVDAKSLGKSLGAVAVLLGEMTATMYGLSKIDNKKMFEVSTAILVLSTAMLNLAISVAILGRMSWQQLALGVSAMGVGLGILVGAIFAFTKIDPSGRKMLAVSGAIYVMASALVILAGAVAAFGSMDMDTLEQGLGGMAAALGIMVLAMLGLDKMKKSVEGIAAAIFVIASAMVVLSAAVLAFGEMDPEVLGQGLTAVAVALALMVGSMTALAALGGEKVVGAAAGILLIATALNMLMPVVITLGLLPWQVVYAGFAAVAAGLALLLAAGAVAGIPLVSAGLVILGGVMLALATALLIAGAGMILFAKGFALLAAVGAAGVAVLVLAFEAFMGLLPQLGMQMAAAVVGFLKVLANASPKIRAALGEIIHNLLGVVIDAIPELAQVFVQLLDTAIDVIQKEVPKFVEAGFTIIDEFLKSANRHIPSIVDSAVDLITKFTHELGQHVKELAQAGVDLVVDILDGITDAIENSDRIRDAAGRMARTFVDELRETLADLIGSIDVGSMLPDVHFGNPFNRGAAGGKGDSRADPYAVLAKTLKNSSKAVNDALATSANIFSDDPAAQAAFLKSRQKQGIADQAQGKANVRDMIANEAEKRAKKAQQAADRKARDAEKKKADKEDKKAAREAKERAERLAREAEKARRKADNAQNAADKKQQTADRFRQAAEDAKAFAEADLTGKGDIKSDLAVTLADKAQNMLQKANAESLAAQKIIDKGEKATKKEREQAEKLRALAQKHAELARQWAQDALQAQKDAAAFYVQAASARLEALKQKVADEKQAADDQAEFDAASTQGQADIMAARAAKSRDLAEKAKLDYLNALAAADAAIKAGDADAANAALDLAETAAEQAKAYADQAYQQQQQAEQLAEQAAQENASGGDTQGGVIQPSRTALEDAAKAVDRHTQSLIDAQEQAGAGGTVYNFNQTNTSPVALSASEIYRQTKNLVSGAVGVP